MLRRTPFLALALALLASPLAAVAQAFPTQTVRFIVPFPPGGSADALTRMLAQRMQAQWNQNVVVENKPGGGTVIGTDLVAKAPPDGHTIALVIPSFAVNPSIMPQLPYDTVKDLAGVTLISTLPIALYATPDLPVTNVAELIAHAKKNPKTLSYGSVGPGSTSHLAGLMLNQMAGIDLVHVPYKGSARQLAARAAPWRTGGAGDQPVRIHLRPRPAALRAAERARRQHPGGHPARDRVPLPLRGHRRTADARRQHAGTRAAGRTRGRCAAAHLSRLRHAPAGSRQGGIGDRGSMKRVEPSWVPTPQRIAGANVTALMRLLEQRHGVQLQDYAQLHRFSLERMGEFWDAMWSFSGVVGERGDGPALEAGSTMREARWFPGARLNFAENLLRRRGDATAATFWNERGHQARISADQLRSEAARMARALRRMGVQPGDRVAAFMPNIPQAMVGMLGCASIGAVWSICATDVSAEAAAERFGQIEPVVLLVADGACHGGRVHDARGKAVQLAAALPSVQHVIAVDDVADGEAPAGWSAFARWEDVLQAEDASPFEFQRFAFAHPLYVLFTSGTTGRPKCIVHGAGGTLLKHMCDHVMQMDVRPGDTIFRVTGSGWMLWNSLMSGLACEATLVLYDGSPLHPAPVILDIAQQERVTLLGLAPPVMEHWARSGLHPAETHELAALRSIAAGGAPLSAETATYVHERVKRDVHLASPSGGTDIISFFLGGHPTGPCYAGQIQAPALGMAMDVFDDAGRPLRGTPGELVCTQPFPSMPLGFWGDADGSRLHAAYYDTFPGVWRHGDWAEITPQGGFVIHGRSDATLKANGVRIGTAEIYAQLTGIAEIVDAAAVDQRTPDGTRIALFVVLAPGARLDDALQERVRTAIARGASPRHVPQAIHAVPELPRTSNGKCSEAAIRAAIHGEPVRNEAALANPQALIALRSFHTRAASDALAS
jgi:acetoacetyl-CoA synthetase